MPSAAFSKIELADFDQDRKVVVYDFWRLLADKISDAENIEYHGAGLGASEGENAIRLEKLWKGNAFAV